MCRISTLRRLALVSLAAGGTLFAGCLGRFENNLDMVLSPNATANVLTLPYTAFVNLALGLVKIASL